MRRNTLSKVGVALAAVAAIVGLSAGMAVARAGSMHVIGSIGPALGEVGTSAGYTLTVDTGDNCGLRPPPVNFPGPASSIDWLQAGDVVDILWLDPSLTVVHIDQDVPVFAEDGGDTLRIERAVSLPSATEAGFWRAAVVPDGGTDLSDSYLFDDMAHPNDPANYECDLLANSPTPQVFQVINHFNVVAASPLVPKEVLMGAGAVLTVTAGVWAVRRRSARLA